MSDEHHMNPQDDDLVRLRSQCDEYLAGWKRAQADYANLKKDTERERFEFIKHANQRLLQEMLPAIDQFEAALSFAPQLPSLSDEEGKKFKNWFTGLQAVRSLWDNAFKDIGLEKVATEGVFNPGLHEAVDHEPSDTAPPGTIVRVVQDGWILNGKLLRPAKVVIAAERNNP